MGSVFSVEPVDDTAYSLNMDVTLAFLAQDLQETLQTVEALQGLPLEKPIIERLTGILEAGR